MFVILINLQNNYLLFPSQVEVLGRLVLGFRFECSALPGFAWCQV